MQHLSSWPRLLPHRKALAALLSDAGIAGVRGPEDLIALPMRGVAHDHIQVGDSGALLRIPRLSQWSLAPAENLAYQAACFRRAEPSGRTPRLLTVLPPDSAVLPRGALLVEAIAGRAPHMATDLTALAESLACLHRLPVPTPPHRRPLADHGAGDGPIAATVALLDQHAAFLDRAELRPAARGLLERELTRLRDLAAASAGTDQPVSLVGTDTHPGNFLIREDGSAILVDLEKALYGAPAIDLAHATLYTSTTWDAAIGEVLSLAETRRFYAAWRAAAPADLVRRSEPWLVPCRRVTWLRTVFWAARWRVVADQDPDWSASRIEPSLLAHIRARVADFLDPATIERVSATLDEPV
ncbi:MAG TPA: phosphotransferase [Stellaceae bacterium]|nr:phosphotransferase [Stellaceae bacterium]